VIYLIEDGNHFKIGISVNPNKRVKQLQTGNGSKLRIVKIFDNPSKIYNERLMERRLHFLLRQFKKTGEWFCFRDMDKDQIIALIEKMLLL
jgi:hypothetical protein